MLEFYLPNVSVYGAGRSTAPLFLDFIYLFLSWEGINYINER
ncbi:MAG: hypothetical protein WCP16_20045 [Pseudanabaena sp. ELA645]